MDEFGVPTKPEGPSSPQTESPTQSTLVPPPTTTAPITTTMEPPSPMRSQHTRAESPAPFSHYVNAANVGEKVGQDVMTVNGALERRREQGVDGGDDGDGGAGCCKCVVM